VRLALDNGRVVQTVDPGGPAASILEYQGAEYLDGCGPEEAGDGELMLVTTPSSPFADRTHNRHSYFCLIHPEHASRVTTDYVYVRNPFFAVDFPGLRTAIPVRVIFDERVLPGRVVVDSTTLFAIGLPLGEPVLLGGCQGKAGRLRDALFGHRHALARVGRTAVIDIEKPVTRLPEEMMDLLGTASGDRVIVEAAADRDGDPHPGLVEAGDRRVGDAAGDHRQHLVDDAQRGAFHPAGHRAGRDRRPEQIFERGGGPRHRQELPVQQIHPDPGQPRPVHDRRDRLRRCGRGGVMPAPAPQGDQLMLSHLRRHRWHIDHLPPGHVDLVRVGQAVPAPGTHRGHMPDHVGIREALQGDAVLAFRPSRTLTRPRTQRLRRRFGQPVRRGRLRRVRRGQLQPGLKIRDPAHRLLQPSRQIHHHRRQAVIRRRRLSGHTAGQPISLHNRHPTHPTTYPVTHNVEKYRSQFILK